MLGIINDTRAVRKGDIQNYILTVVLKELYRNCKITSCTGYSETFYVQLPWWGNLVPATHEV